MPGRLTVPPGAHGLVVLTRDPADATTEAEVVARQLVDASVGAADLDLFAADSADGGDPVDADVIAVRLLLATRWMREHSLGRGQCVGYFGSRTVGTAALLAAAEDPTIAAVVAHDSRPDLALPRLSALRAATLLIVEHADEAALRANEEASRYLRCRHELLELGPESPDRARVAELAATWFARHLTGDQPESGSR